jgi:hypothetical protein
MAEVDGIVGIYGSVDQVVQTNEDSRAEVSRLLPLYRDRGLHWYDDFERWLRRTGREPVEERETLFPGLTDALRELAEIEPRGRMRARRLFAIAVAARAFPEMREPGSELASRAARALRVGTLAASEMAAHELLERLADDRTMPSLDGTGPQDLGAWWEHLIAIAHAEGLIPDTAGMLPRPCSGRLVKVPGVAGVVAALKTEFVTEEVEFEAATRFLAPSNWETCMPWFWCDMTELRLGVLPGMHVYREVVSSDCASGAGAALRAETELEFNFVWLPEGATAANAEAAVTNYQLAEGRPQPTDLIRVDEGSLVVARIGPGPKRLLITTTKRIQFNFPFSSQALATMMCPLGYADVAGDLLYCAASNAGAPGAGTDFPAAAPAPGAGPGSAGPPNAGSAGGECAHPAGQLVHDMAGMWARVLREGASALEHGAQGTGTSTRTRNRSGG